MKKVKIMLTAITIFSVVGAGLAVKAKTFQSGNIYTSNGTGVCNILSTQLSFDNASPEAFVTGTIVSPTCVQNIPVDIVP